MSSGAERTLIGEKAGTTPSLSETVAGDTVADTLTESVPRSPAGLDTGTTLGRYVVTGRLGAGAMGVVYAAFDPQLDRKVAIKILRNEPMEVGSKASLRSNGHERLLREAKAMAKLHHPNVIVVHDVGTVDDQVFIAMEHLDGGTLHDHLKEEPRPWRDVLDKLRRAGAGLAAAHEAGIVHRDFKPHNVLLGRDGRVCVMDFGLAQTGASSTWVDDGPGDATTESTDDSTDALSRLTRTGAIVGTPAYMAPEQHSQGVVDARSDQFSFCVAFYEGLYGVRPFEGDTLATLAYHVLRGEQRPPPADRIVPRWLHRIVTRGLSVDPDDRYASMAELLAQLDVHPARRRRWAVGLAATTFAGLGVAVSAMGRSDRATCTGGRERVDEVWNEPARQQVREAFVATGESSASDIWSSIERDLDAYAHNWATMHKEACEATRLRGEQSEELLDRRMLCLEQRRRGLDELVKLLGDADDHLVHRARGLVDKRSRLEPCADAQGLLAGVEPADPAVRERVLGAEAVLKKVMMLRDVSRFDAAQTALDEVAAEIDTLAHAPTRVALLYLQSAVAGDMGRLDDAERLAYDSAVLAAECGDDAAAARAWTGLVRIVGLQRRKFEELPPILKAAEAAVARISDEFLRAGYLATVGTVDIVRERYAEAEQPLREAHRLMSRIMGPEDPRTLDAYEMLAVSLQYQDRIDEAEPIFREIVAAYEKREAPHPALGQTLGNLATLVELKGDDEEARAIHHRALEVLLATYGPDHPVVATVHYHLGKLARRKGELDIAANHLEREREILTKAHGPNAQPVGYSHHGQGQLELAREQPDAAIASFRRAIEIWEASLGSEHIRLAEPLTGIARAHMMAGRADAAVPSLERALGLREAADGAESTDLAVTKSILARALWESGGDRTRSRELAEQARAVLAQAGHDSLSEIDAWLAERGR
jgi:eukaryotic-like serine/threonine-protein kinase